MMRWLLVVAALQIAAQANAAQPNCDQFAEVRAVVDTYYKSAKTDAASVQPALAEMLKEPRGASCWLVRDIKEVRRERLTAAQAVSSEVIWALRGLRFLTNCTEFRGALTRKQSINPQDVRWQLLLQNGVEKIPFFRTWMARDIVVVAPVEVQHQVIAAWQSWYSSAASTFSYQQCGSLDGWYF